MKITKNPAFLHYFSKFMEILFFVLKYMYISLLLKMINGFSWPAKIMASPFNVHLKENKMRIIEFFVFRAYCFAKREMWGRGGPRGLLRNNSGRWVGMFSPQVFKSRVFITFVLFCFVFLFFIWNWILGNKYLQKHVSQELKFSQIWQKFGLKM